MPDLDRIATLHFIDGTKLSFEFPEQSSNPAAKQLKLADFMTSKHLVVEAEGQLFIFPVDNIKYIVLSLPTLPKKDIAAMARHAIAGARLRS